MRELTKKGGIRVRKAFADQAFMSFLGASLSDVASGACEIQLPIRPELTQQHGFVHGGVVATLADNAGGFASMALMDEDEEPLSIEFKISLLRAAQGDTLVARARVVKDGRRFKVAVADVFARQRDREERHCATAIVTVAVNPGDGPHRLAGVARPPGS